MADVVRVNTAGLRPAVLKMANRMGSPRKLSFDKLVNGARSTARATDFGDDSWEEPLRVLVDSVNSEARLSYLGSLIMKQRLKGALVTRLRAIALFKQHPEILDVEVAPVRLITGLQRTGTTFLQRLLSIPADARALLSWEALDPVPRNGRAETNSRIRSARLSERALAWMSPGFFAIHPIDHLRPEEDVLLLDSAFMTTAPEAMMHVPSFASWLERQDHTIAYEWERKMLKLLQWQRPAKHWVLKSPHHLEHMAVIRKVFPDIKIIWMHRDPGECVSSFLSMVYHGRAMFSDSVSHDEVATHWLRKNAHMVHSAMEQLSEVQDVLIGAHFNEIVQDPVALVRRLYKGFGVDATLSEEDEMNLRQEVASHTRHRFGRHEYHLSDFGLTREEVTKRFEKYLQSTIAHE